MIRIKRLFPILLLFLFVSCSPSSPTHPLEKADSVYGIFESGDFTVNVTLSRSENLVTVIPDTPKEYSITFKNGSAEVFYGDKTHKLTSPSISRFSPLYEMALGINTEILKDRLVHGNGAVFKVTK